MKPEFRNPRVIVPPSQRIRNRRTLPVEGAGPRSSIKPLLYGALSALFVIIFFAVRH